MVNHILLQGWELKTLGEVCEIYTGNSINQAKKEKEFTNLKEGLNYIATKDIGFDNVINYNNGVKIPFEKVKDFKTAKVNSSLLCIEGGSAGRKIGFTNQKVCFVNKLCCFETLQDEPRYIYYYLQSDYFMQRFRLNMSGLIGGVSKDRIKQIKIPLPPLEIQKAIVEKLENAFAHIDEAVRHLKVVQTNIPRLKSSLLHCAFSSKLTESQNQSNEVQTLKSVVGVEGEFEREEGATSPFKPIHPLIKEEIPQGWEVKTLGEVFKVIGGGTPSTANPKFWSGDIAWITSANIASENFTITPQKFINQEAIKSSVTKLVPKNTIIVVTRVGLGKVGITDVETCFSQDSQALLPLMDLNVKFMAFK